MLKQGHIQKTALMLITGLVFGAITPTFLLQAQTRSLNKQIEYMNSEIVLLNSTVLLLKEQSQEANLKMLALGAHIDIFYGNITVDQAYRLISASEKFKLLDVRTETEFNESHIQDAINIPLNQLPERIDELNETYEYVVYCKSGYKSHQAFETLKENGFQKIYNMLGGLEDWRNHNYGVEYPGTSSCPCQNN